MNSEKNVPEAEGRVKRAYDFIKLKPVWVLMFAGFGYMFWRHGWEAMVSVDAMVVKAQAVAIGALLGLMVDAVHFRLWPPTSENPDYENRRRRAFFIGLGMLSMALSV